MNSSDSSTYKTTSDHLSMLMGSNSSYRSQNLENNHQQPKLENFLGRHSFVADEHHIGGQSSSGTHAYNNNSTSSTSTSSSNIGLSMIKTWLRNQPAPVMLPHHHDHHDHHDHQQRINKNDINTTDTTTTTSSSAVQTLSLSMSTGSHTHHNTTSTTAAGETCSSDRDNTCNNNNKLAVVRTTASTAPPPGIDSQTTSTTATAIEAVPRKSVDTFGQRTSIYRGVTR